MCYQFPIRLQNAGAGDRALLPAPGAAGVGEKGPRTSLLPDYSLFPPEASGSGYRSSAMQCVAKWLRTDSTHREEASDEGLQH